VLESEVGNELSVVNPSLGSIIDSVLTTVEALLGSDELEREPLVGGKLGDVLKELGFAADFGLIARTVGVRGDPDKPARLAKLALLEDHGTQRDDLSVFEPLLTLDDDSLSLLERRPLRVAENDAAIFVLVDPDARVVASGIK